MDKTSEEATAGLTRALADPAVRRQVLRMCARAARGPAEADDLAQEVMLEAWRLRGKVTDPTGLDRWLAAVTRIVLLRARSAREALIPEEPAPASSPVEDALEEAELGQLVLRALGGLPPESREVLVRRYVDEESVQAIATTLGVTADAVSMRLTRARRMLRRELETTWRDQAQAFGLAPDAPGWTRTQVWCTHCGAHTLLMKRESMQICFRCSSCDPEPTDVSSAFDLANPFFGSLLGSLSRPSAMLNRAAAWTHDYYSDGAATGGVACTACSAPVPLATYQRDRGPRERSLGLAATCGTCGCAVSSSLESLALATPAVRAFRARHRRIRATQGKATTTGAEVSIVFSAKGGAYVRTTFEPHLLRLVEVSGSH